MSAAAIGRARSRDRREPARDGFYVFCDGAELVPSIEAQCRAANAAGIPTLLLPVDADPSAMCWPRVPRVAVFGHDVIDDAQAAALAAAMIDAGVDEVFFSGCGRRGPMTFEAS